MRKLNFSSFFASLWFFHFSAGAFATADKVTEKASRPASLRVLESQNLHDSVMAFLTPKEAEAFGTTSHYMHRMSFAHPTMGKQRFVKYYQAAWCLNRTQEDFSRRSRLRRKNVNWERHFQNCLKETEYQADLAKVLAFQSEFVRNHRGAFTWRDIGDVLEIHFHKLHAKLFKRANRWGPTFEKAQFVGKVLVGPVKVATTVIRAPYITYREIKENRRGGQRGPGIDWQLVAFAAKTAPLSILVAIPGTLASLAKRGHEVIEYFHTKRPELKREQEKYKEKIKQDESAVALQEKEAMAPLLESVQVGHPNCDVHVLHTRFLMEADPIFRAAFADLAKKADQKKVLHGAVLSSVAPELQTAN